MARRRRRSRRRHWAARRQARVRRSTRAVAQRSRRDRNLLRLHLLGGVTLEQLAQMYSVHRATIVRWLAAARAALLDATRAQIADQVGAADLDEMFDLVRSRVELSI